MAAQAPLISAPVRSKTLRQDFAYRRQIALKSGYNEVAGRLVGLLTWMQTVPLISRLLEYLDQTVNIREMMYEERYTDHWYCRDHLNARTIDEIAAVGFELIRYAAKNDTALHTVGRSFGVWSGKWNAGHQVNTDAVVAHYVTPFLDWIDERLPESDETRHIKTTTAPAIIFDSMKKFRAQHRNVAGRCFIMMRFGETRAHVQIERAIKATLHKHRLTGLLARDKEFHEDLFPNILTYMHGCDFGIAVFERLESEVFNPNVALEVGYMLGLRKQVLLLKDQTLQALHTDLVGKLYREFNPQKPTTTIPREIEKWLTDKGLA
jgi:hypothetical protein